MTHSQDQLVNDLVRSGVLTRSEIKGAFQSINRAGFVSQEFKDSAYDDIPLPIPGGMTTSQPSTIAFMLELLRVQRGDTVLEIGTGSGYLTALLATLVGSDGLVTSVEHSSELYTFARENLAPHLFSNVTLVCGDGKIGYEQNAPYHRIISSADAFEVPSAWLGQLSPGGILITPHQGVMLRIRKTARGNLRRKKFGQFVFIVLR